MKLTASQIRQDINCFGGFGRQGYGYAVADLREHMGTILGVDQIHQMIIIGAGNIGRAVALSDSFLTNGFKTIALFDSDPRKIGASIGGILVRDIDTVTSFLAEQTVDIVVLAVPIDTAQAVADVLCANGVRAIWNFVPVDLKLPPETKVVSVHLDEGLEILSFKMKYKENA